MKKTNQQFYWVDWAVRLKLQRNNVPLEQMEKKVVALRKPGLCMCGCGNKTNLVLGTSRTRGWIIGMPKMFIQYHAVGRPRISPVINQETGCWEAQGALRNGYYPALYYNGEYTPGHRAFYQRLKAAIPRHLDLDHLCRNRRCVNPDHLEPVEPKENCRRGSATKLNNDSVQAIKALIKAGAVYKKIAEQFHISVPTISDIKNGKTWSDIK